MHQCTDSDEIFVVLTNEMTLPPGVLCETYRLRWRIEKSFDQQEQKLDERKAWATSDTAKTIQVISICIANNLLQLFKATLKTEEGIEDTKVIKASHKDLDRREANAKNRAAHFLRRSFLTSIDPPNLAFNSSAGYAPRSRFRPASDKPWNACIHSWKVTYRLTMDRVVTP